MLDPNDRTTPRPCEICSEEFTPGARGPVATTCGSERCRKARQRRERKARMTGRDSLDVVHLYAYAEPLDAPRSGRPYEARDARLDLDAEEALPYGVLYGVLVEEYGLRLDVEHDDNGRTPVAYLYEVETEEARDHLPEEIRRAVPTPLLAGSWVPVDVRKSHGWRDQGSSRRRDLAALRRLAKDRPEVEEWLAGISPEDLDDLPPLIP